MPILPTVLDRSGSRKLSTALGGHCPEQPKSHKVGRQVHACDARNLDNPVPDTHGCLGGCGHQVPVERSLVPDLLKLWIAVFVAVLVLGAMGITMR